MIEDIMVFVLGALTAGLISIAILPAFWRRAERLVRRELERQLPLSPREIAAERDQLRAVFAVRERRLEETVEQIAEARALDQMDLGRKLLSLDTAKAEIIERDARIVRLEQDIAGRIAEIGTLQAALEAETGAHATSRATLAERESTLAALQAEHAAALDLSEQRRLAIEKGETDLAEAGAAVEREKAMHADTRQSLADQRRLHKDLQAAFVTLREQSDERRRLIVSQASDIDRLRSDIADQSRSMQALRQTIQAKSSEINGLQRDLADERNRSAIAVSERDAVSALAERRQQAVEAKSDALQQKGTQINELTVQIATLRAELSAEVEARKAAERRTEVAERRAAGLEASIQSVRQQSQETARDLSRTIETLKADAAQLAEARAKPEERPARQPPRRRLELASTPIPERDIVGLPPRK